MADTIDFAGKVYDDEGLVEAFGIPMDKFRGLCEAKAANALADILHDQVLFPEGESDHLAFTD